MKVCVITSLRRECGIGLYSEEFLKELLKNEGDDFQIVVITHRNSNVPAEVERDKRLIVYKVIDENIPNYVIKISKILNKENPDVIDIEWDHNLYSPRFLLGLYIFPVIRKYREKVFLSLHSLYKTNDVYNFLKNRKVPLSKLLSKYYETTKKFLLENSRILRVFTNYELSQVKDYEDKSILIRQGISKFHYDDTIKDNKEIRLLSFGFIRETKNYDLLLSSMKYLDDRFKLYIVGKPVDKKTFLNIIKKIRKYELRKKITLITRFIPNNTKISLMKNSHILLLPYRLISNSGVLIDGIKYCKPIISTVLKEDLKILKIGEFSNEDEKEFAEKIYKIVENYSYYTKSIRKIRKEFKWNRIIKKTVKVFYKISA